MKVSVFIPVYNGEKYISNTLDSVLAQQFHDFEVLCVDDGSTDGSYSLLQQYSSKDERIKIFRKSNEGDVPHVWQFIISKIQGEFVLYMSQDDLLEPDTLDKLVRRQEETDADGVIPSVIWYVEGAPMDNQHNLIGVAGDTGVILDGKEAFELMMDYSISGFGIWRANLVKKHPVIPLAFNSDEYSQRDWCSRCQKVAFSDGRFLYGQNNPNAITHQFTDKQIEASLTDAMVLKRAVEVGVETETITRYANDKYQKLWFNTMWLMVFGRGLSRKRKRRLRRLFSDAHRMLAPYVTLTQWKYRASKKNLFFFWIIVIAKTIKANLAK